MVGRGIQTLIFLACAGFASAHPALYHYLEINLHQPGEVTVFVTLHAPELSDEVAPLEEDVFGAEWLSSLDDETIAELVANAHRFGDEKFDFRFEERTASLALVFPNAESIRYPGEDSEIPAGCFSGTAAVAYQSGEEMLTLDFTATAEKRLMLVINRPGEFPEVFDIEPGTSRTIPLPPAPVPSGVKSYAIALTIAGVLLVVGITLIRRRRACVQQ